MNTHILTFDRSEGATVYSSVATEYLKVYRRDLLKAYTSGIFYSEFTEEEKSAAFKVNGIGIRAVIPLSIPNAFTEASLTEQGDENVTVMINVSPFSYGCTDEDKLDLDAVYEYMNRS